MSTEPDVLGSTDEVLIAMIAPVKAKEAALEAEEDQLVIRLRAVRDERIRLRNVLKQVDPEWVPVRPTLTKRPTRPAGKVSEAQVESVRAVVSVFEDEWITRNVIDSLPGMSDDSVRKALVKLRDAGEVRVIALQKGRGGGYTFVTTPKGKKQEPVMNGSSA
jgi:hypothetical protein